MDKSITYFCSSETYRQEGRDKLPKLDYVQIANSSNYTTNEQLLVIIYAERF